MNSEEAPTFFIKSGDDGFASRQRNIFDQLNLLDQEINRNALTKPVGNYSESLSLGDNEATGSSVAVMRRRRRETKAFRGKESIFKRPETLPPRFKTHNMPDYRRRPDKWVKYSLADVSKEDMSDQSNTATAMAFLQELAARKNKDCEEETEDKAKIIFKPKEKVAELCGLTDVSSSNSGLFRSSKLIMPEYVVGRETKKPLKRSGIAVPSKRKEVRLDHLDEKEDSD